MPLSKPDAAAVIAITGTDLPEPVVSSIIDDAALLADNLCTAAYPADRQITIVKWLSAHLIASTSDKGSQVLSSSKLGDAQDSYARGTLGEGLKGTAYGQQVLLLDTNGCLSRLGKARASIERV